MNSPTSFGRRGAAPPLARPTARAPALAVDSPAPAAPDWVIASDPDRLPRLPLVTLGLIGLLALIFLGQQHWGFEPGELQSYRSLVAMGADRADLVLAQGQWWRVMTAMLLHGGVEHLVGNCVALLIAGLMLERRLGGAWFAAIFVLGGVAGSLASLVYNPEGTLSVGASGAIMALLVPCLIEAFGNETVYTPKRARLYVLMMVASALIPTDSHIDYRDHLGGAMVGGMFGYVLLIAVPELHDAPAGRRIASGVAVLGALAAAIGFGFAAAAYPALAARDAALIPDERLKAVMAGQAAAAPEARESQALGLIARYPHDPRSHMALAVALLQDRKIDEAEDEIRGALTQEDVLARDLPPDTGRYLHGLLGAIVFAEGRQDEGRAEARTVCAGHSTAPNLVKLKAALQKEGVCG
jgi:rhomboid protease GluP